MATALIASISKHLDGYKIIATDKNQQNLDFVKNNYSVQITSDNKIAIDKADIIFLCVKPQDMGNLLDEIKTSITKNQLIVSIAAGLKISFYEKYLPLSKIVRVMPNTPALVSQMAAVYSSNTFVNLEDLKEIHAILNLAGLAMQVEENKIDIVTAVSGSGPAFFAIFMDEIINEAKKLGLDEQMARKLCYQTAIGTGKLLLEKNMSPNELVKMVASPGGTTEAGLKILDTKQFRTIVKNTIDTTVNQSKEMGKNG